MLRAGYHSHYVLTNASGKPASGSEKTIYDEIVINQENQVIFSTFILFHSWLFVFSEY